MESRPVQATAVVPHLTALLSAMLPTDCVLHKVGAAWACCALASHLSKVHDLLHYTAVVPVRVCACLLMTIVCCAYWWCM